MSCLIKQMNNFIKTLYLFFAKFVYFLIDLFEKTVVTLRDLVAQTAPMDTMLRISNKTVNYVLYADSYLFQPLFSVV